MFPQTKELIETFLKEGVFPGATYGFIRKQVIDRQCTGFAKITPTKEKMTMDTLFDVASLTKVICTNTVILKLIEEKKIELDRPLHHYLPAFKETKVTIRHLLTHTSDINPFIKNRDTLIAEELRSALLQLRSGDLIGNEMAYTDTGTLLLGFLIEEIYHNAVQDVFQQEVLTPLGMNNSTFSPTTQKIAATELHPVRGLISGQVHDPKAFVLGEHCGSAGLFTNLEDCISFVKMILNGGESQDGKQFLKEATINNLFCDQTPTKTLNRSLGWDLKFDHRDQHRLLFHTGYTGTFMLIDKQQQEAFIFLSNRVHPMDQRNLYLAKRDAILLTYLKEKAQNK